MNLIRKFSKSALVSLLFVGLLNCADASLDLNRLQKILAPEHIATIDDYYYLMGHHDESEIEIRLLICKELGWGKPFVGKKNKCDKFLTSDLYDGSKDTSLFLKWFKLGLPKPKKVKLLEHKLIKSKGKLGEHRPYWTVLIQYGSLDLEFDRLPNDYEFYPTKIGGKDVSTIFQNYLKTHKGKLAKALM